MTSADILVIGGGIAGASAAYELAAVDALCDSHVRAVAAMPPWRKPSCVARRQGRNAVRLADSAAPPPVC